MSKAMKQHAVRRVVHHVIGRRGLSTTSPRNASPLFALGALSNSRETQHFARESRLSRIEHSPNLQLIQSSEVDPFAAPRLIKRVAPAVPPPKLESPKPVVQKALSGLKETDLLSVGRAILLEKDEQIQSLARALEEEKDRSLKREATYALARTKSRDRIMRLHGDLSSERLWKWTFLLLGLSGCAWLYASKTGKVSWALGDEPIAKVVTASTPILSTPEVRPAPVARPSLQPKPAPVAESQSDPQSFSFSRLFWRP